MPIEIVLQHIPAELRVPGPPRLLPAQTEQCARTVTTFYRVDVASGDVEMNDEHSDYRWITGDTGDLHPFVTEMTARSEIF